MNKKGFTLIELLVVIAIIALLLSIVAPALRKAKDAAKLSICASNQHQCMAGVFAYSADNSGKMPPDISRTNIAGIPNSWANCLNYHPGAPAANNSGAMYTYLGSYLPEVHVFMCPSAPSGDRTKFVQDLYENPLPVGGGTTLVSYNMYWGGYTIPQAALGMAYSRDFVGPRGAQGARMDASLMMCDVMSFWNPTYALWLLSHRPDRGDIQSGTNLPGVTPPLNAEMLWWLSGTVSNIPKGLKMAAGYTDGSVIRYTSDGDTISYIQSVHLFYMPKRWR